MAPPTSSLAIGNTPPRPWRCWRVSRMFWSKSASMRPTWWCPPPRVGARGVGRGGGRGVAGHRAAGVGGGRALQVGGEVGVDGGEAPRAAGKHPVPGAGVPRRSAGGGATGIGPVAAARLREVGINTVAQLRAQPVRLLERLLGTAGGAARSMAVGQDSRTVGPSREVKASARNAPWTSMSPPHN